MHVVLSYLCITGADPLQFRFTHISKTQNLNQSKTNRYIMTKYYTPYELVQRLDAIPTVAIRTFEEPYDEDGEWQAQINIDFPDEFDETAYNQVKKVVENASNWYLDEPATPSTGIITIHFSIDTSMPTKLLAKFDLA